jgi:hypothetical protein
MAARPLTSQACLSFCLAMVFRIRYPQQPPLKLGVRLASTALPCSRLCLLQSSIPNHQTRAAHWNCLCKSRTCWAHSGCGWLDPPLGSPSFSLRRPSYMVMGKDDGACHADCSKSFVSCLSHFPKPWLAKPSIPPSRCRLAEGRA